MNKKTGIIGKLKQKLRKLRKKARLTTRGMHPKAAQMLSCLGTVQPDLSYKNITTRASTQSKRRRLQRHKTRSK